MPEIRSYAPGTPSWVDLGTTDAEAARSFYRELFGWEFEVGGPETGGYAMAKLHGRSVAGLWTLMPEMTAQGVPPNWTTYFSTDDVAGSATRITDAGGTILNGPMDVMDQGRMAVATDPTGAVFGLWEPAAHRGAELVNEPGALVWNELNSRDVPRAQAFYQQVFGFGTAVTDAGDGSGYTMLKVGDQPVAGLMAVPAAVPPQVPSYWLTYFAVADPDETAAAAGRAGGVVQFGPQTTPGGRFAVLADPQGAIFAVMGVTAGP